MFTEEQIRHLFGGIGLIPPGSTQFDITNSERRKRSSLTTLGNYTRVDTIDGVISVKIRGFSMPYQGGYEIPIFEVPWEVSHCIDAIDLGDKECTLKGEGLTIYVGPRTHLGGSDRALLGSSRGGMLTLDTISIILAFSTMNEKAIWELLDMTRDRGRVRSTFVSREEEYNTLFPKSSKEDPWRQDYIPGFLTDYPIFYLKRTNGWGLSLP